MADYKKTKYNGTKTPSRSGRNNWRHPHHMGFPNVGVFLPFYSPRTTKEDGKWLNNEERCPEDISLNGELNQGESLRLRKTCAGGAGLDDLTRKCFRVRTDAAPGPGEA